MVQIIPFKCFYPLSLTDFALPMISSDVDISADVKSLDDNDLLKIPANIRTSDYKRVFQEILTLGHARKYEALNRYWPNYETLGFFHEEKEEHLYVYRMEYSINNNKFQQTGVICCLKLDKDTILGHENTFKDKIEDQVNRLEKHRASISPVFLLYDDSDEHYSNSFDLSDQEQTINYLLNKITYSFPIIDLISSNEVRHSIWKVTDPILTNQLVSSFQNKKKVYIADGHHRVASSFYLKRKLKEKNPNHTGREPYNYILSAIFPISQSSILEYNRVVKNVKKFRKDILPVLYQKFDVDELDSFEKPETKGTFIIYAKRRWYKATLKQKFAKKHKHDIVEKLDSFIIQEYIFKEIFNIKKPRGSNKIAYIPGSWSIYQLIDVAESENGVAFILPPISIQDIITIADSKKIVPPKTTWFEPKLLKGMMFWKF